MSAPLKVWLEEGGGLVRMRLARPKANIVDAEMIAALDAAFAEYPGKSEVKAVLLDADGPHFSFGASVEEHLPDRCAGMIAGLHALLKKMTACPVPLLVAVQGQCLGGGLEVAMAGNLIFAAPDAQFGQPEIKLGVFAPAASVLLPLRTGQARAEDLLFSGRSVGAEEAARWGLVTEVTDDPAAVALGYFTKRLAPLSASSLRQAVKAVRAPVAAQAAERLDAVERQYLDELMATRDAVEGLESFIEKRPAQWENR